MHIACVLLSAVWQVLHWQQSWDGCWHDVQWTGVFSLPLQWVTNHSAGGSSALAWTRIQGLQLEVSVLYFRQLNASSSSEMFFVFFVHILLALIFSAKEVVFYLTFVFVYLLATSHKSYWLDLTWKFLPKMYHWISKYHEILEVICFWI